MTLIWGYGYLHRKYPSVALPNSFLSPFKLRNKLSNQPTRPLRAKFFTTVIFVTASTIFKYIERDLQQIFKTILEAQVPTTSEKLWDKLLKARFPNVYCEKSYMEYYNFCQQFENYFAAARARKANQIFFAMSFSQNQNSFR